MNFTNMSDEQIINLMRENIEKKRIHKQIKVSDLAKKGGFSTQVYSNFINRNVNIKINTIIQIFRALDELDSLQDAFIYKEEYSPASQKNSIPKRVRTKKNNVTKRVKWGD